MPLEILTSFRNPKPLLMLLRITLGLIFVLVLIWSTRAQPAIPPAFGPYLHPSTNDFADASTFKTSQRIVGTYYFYWYNVQTKEHIINGDGTDALTDHPATKAPFSYTSVQWHRQELLEMIDAAIDVVLPVFWGAPSEHPTNAPLHWSFAGIPNLIEAREQLLREGKQPPRIGLFYDTSTLQHNSWGQHIDLSTGYGKQWFYATLRDFFSMVPAKHWAMIDGKPIVLLYSAAFAKKQDPSLFAYAKEQFAKDFGGRVPWIAREISWQGQADSTVAWGGALGLKNPGVASVGPGYDHSAVPGRAPLIVDRRHGQFYEDNWLKLLRRPASFVMVETWNEFHEGTEVAASKEYGRQYIELTRKYSNLFKQGWQPPATVGKYSSAQSVAVTLGSPNAEAGLRQLDHDDGQTIPAFASERPARQLAPGSSRYFYFAVDDSFKTPQPSNFIVEVEYCDLAPGLLNLEFDGMDEAAPFNGAYTRSADSIKLSGDHSWKTARFCLNAARFLNGQNHGADFRLALQAPALAVASVKLNRN